MSADVKNVGYHEKYHRMGVVSGVEVANNHHRKGKSAARKTQMYEIRDNELKTRTVSGNAKH